MFYCKIQCNSKTKQTKDDICFDTCKQTDTVHGEVKLGHMQGVDALLVYKTATITTPRACIS